MIDSPPPRAASGAAEVPARGAAAIPFRFDLRELSGSLGDLGTFLPLVVGMALVTRLDLGMVFICAGALNILTGLLFRQPLPVQPMKALAAIAITEGLGLGPVVAAGLIMGVLLVGLSLSGAIEQVNRLVSKPLVRGIQLCVGLKLILEGGKLVLPLPVLGWDSWMTTVVLMAAVAVLLRYRQPGLLWVFVLGFALLYVMHPGSYAGVGFTPPRLTWHWPARGEWWSGLVWGALPQLPLTLLNSVVAVCALSADYFPGHGIHPRRMAWSVGFMNLLTVPLSGVPMCHGAGGLAGQYRFGARTGGSVIMLGIAKIAAGVLFGGAMLGLLVAYPKSILGLMLVIAGGSLGWVASDTRTIRGWLIVLVTVVVGIAVNVAVGFAAGGALVLMLRWLGSTGAGGGRAAAPAGAERGAGA